MTPVNVAELCKIVAKEIPITMCIVSPSDDQIAVKFNNRPGVKIHLLTPYYQIKLKNGGIPQEDIPPLIDEVRKLAEKRVYSDTILKDLVSWFEDIPHYPVLPLK